MRWNLEEIKFVATKSTSTKTIPTRSASTKTIPTKIASTNFYILLAFSLITIALIAISIYIDESKNIY